MSENDSHSHFKNVISATANALFGNEGLEQTILKDGPYNKILRDTIMNIEGKDALIRFKPSYPEQRKRGLSNFYERRNGDDCFSNEGTNSKTAFKVLTYLNDELLHDIPGTDSEQLNRRLLSNSAEESEAKQPSSLFQGFEASIPLVNKAIEHHAADNYITNGEETAEAKNEEGVGLTNDLLNAFTDLTTTDLVDTDRISRSYSLKYLKGLSEELIRNLNLIFIQKDINSEEFDEIERRLNTYKNRLALTSEKIEKAEKNELYIENALSLIRDRITFIQEYDLEMDTKLNETEKSVNFIENLETSSDIKQNSKEETFTQEESDVRSTRTAAAQKSKESIRSESVFSRMKNKHSVTPNRLQKFYCKENRKVKKVTKLQKLYEPGTQILSIKTGHDNGIAALDFDAPYGTLATAGNLDQTIKLWDLTRNIQIAELQDHLASIHCMQMGSYYNMLISGSKDATLKLWDTNLSIQLYQENTNISSKEPAHTSCIHTFEAHTDEITSLSFDAVNLVSGSQDKTIRQWDLVSGKCVQTIDLSLIVRRNLNEMSLQSPQPGYSRIEESLVGAIQCFDAALATGTNDGIVRLWDLRSGKVIRAFEGHMNAVTCLKFDSNNLVSGSKDKSIRIWNLRTGTLENAFAYELPVMAMDFDNDNLVSAVNDVQFKVLNRREDTQWTCGDETNTVPITNIKYKQKYAIEGRTDGSVNAWVV